MSVLTSAGKPKYDFSIQIDLTSTVATFSPTGSSTVYINPRYTNQSTADAFTWSSSGDYAPAAAAGGNAYYDFWCAHTPAQGNWYNYTYDTNAGRRGSSGSPDNGTPISDRGRASLWADISVANAPHPGVGVAQTNLAIIMGGYGAYNFWDYGGPPSDPSSPRVLFDDSGFRNFKISGQNYGNIQYNQWFCLGHYQNSGMNNVRTIRVINIGGQVIGIKSLILLLHGVGGMSGD
jgi:hypothetical protein